MTPPTGSSTTGLPSGSASTLWTVRSPHCGETRRTTMGTTELIVEPGRQDVVVVHDFDAPPEIAFRAYTDPELMPRWKGSDRFAVVVDEHDLRVGGRWRLVMTRGDGTEYPMRGVFHEVS